MSNINLGTSPTESDTRDAIHIALAPIIAGEDLYPGNHIEMGKDGLGHIAKEPNTAIGIADPFMTRTILKGERFWLCLYPQTVTDMKHHWSHPAFLPVAELPDVLKAKEVISNIASSYGVRVDELIEAAQSGEGYCFGNDISYGDFEDDFWNAIETITGKQFNEIHRSDTTFRCAC